MLLCLTTTSWSPTPEEPGQRPPVRLLPGTERFPSSAHCVSNLERDLSNSSAPCSDTVESEPPGHLLSG